MRITENTTVKRIEENIKNLLYLNDDNFKVIKLEDDNKPLIIFQIILYNKSINLNDVFLLGLGGLNPSFLPSDNDLLITFHIEKIDYSK